MKQDRIIRKSTERAILEEYNPKMLYRPSQTVSHEKKGWYFSEPLYPF